MDADEGPPEEPKPLGRPVQVNQADLVRGMICVGKKKAVTLLREPERRTSEVHGLASLLDAYVAFTSEGPQTSAFYDELDSREKASFSYRVGMGLALLAAQHALEIPWLMHAASLEASGGPHRARGHRART
ncbi:hypothetical protein BRD56_04655 [Thermoplasmatales archaeon SW_10_69_26]|nr:MAG: hypothetical protein BRD56_04655 [Thermoplasmatales archaeon SW_10_69_26]